MVWLWGLGPVVFFASGVIALVLASFAPPGHDWMAFVPFLACIILNGWLFLRFPACPRCGLNVFLEIRDRWLPFRGQYLFSRLRRRTWRPNPVCARCGLDLKRHGLFDAGARS
jgi:hypothetical protein